LVNEIILYYDARSKKHQITLLHGYNDQSVNAVKEIIAFCSEIHRKLINTPCGMNIEIPKGKPCGI